MKTGFVKAIAFLLILSSVVGLSGCFEYKEELYPMPKIRRDDIISMMVSHKFVYSKGWTKDFKIPEEDYDLIVGYINSAVPYKGIIESEFDKCDYRKIIYIDYVEKYTFNDDKSIYIFQKDGETFIEWNPDAITFNYELCKVDNALFELLDSYS